MAAVLGSGISPGSGVVARGVKVLDPSTDSVSEAGVLVGRQGELLWLETGEGAKSIKEDFRVVACVLLDGQARRRGHPIRSTNAEDRSAPTPRDGPSPDACPCKKVEASHTEHFDQLGGQTILRRQSPSTTAIPTV